MNQWMFNDTPARKPIGYWVSEQGRCMKWYMYLTITHTHIYIYTYTHIYIYIHNYIYNVCVYMHMYMYIYITILYISIWNGFFWHPKSIFFITRCHTILQDASVLKTNNLCITSVLLLTSMMEILLWNETVTSTACLLTNTFTKSGKYTHA